MFCEFLCLSRNPPDWHSSSVQEKPRKGRSKPPVINVPRPNLKELAASLGISVSAVSRVLSGRAEQNRIAPATRELVLAAASQS